MHANAVDFVSYTVSDIEASIPFYRDTLGLPLEHGGVESGWCEFAIPPTTLFLDEANEHSAVSPGGGGVGVALAVHDVEEAVDELRAAGTTILKAPFDAGVCDIAMIADPDGNPITLHHRHDGTAGRRDPFL